MGQYTAPSGNAALHLMQFISSPPKITPPGDS
nr:MAG TPA: hypothetical protein [Caudoviricetes sp.]DAW38997.1 MAG TPA: hypothetical protein [Caudoviricetes sp.]